MNLIPDIQNMKQAVIKLLTEFPHLRDNDNRLIASLWKLEIKGMGIDPQEGTRNDTLRLIAEGKLSSSETIRRARQKVQEEIPELRGTSYLKRKITGDNVRKNINAA